MADVTLQIRLNGGSVQTGAVTAAVGDTIQLTAANKTGWNVSTVRWEIYDYPPDFTVPAGWSTDADGVFYVLGSADPPSFVCDEWGKYLTRVIAANQTDERTIVDIASPSGLKDWMVREGSQAGGNRLTWVAGQKANIRRQEAALAPTASAALALADSSETITLGAGRRRSAAVSLLTAARTKTLSTTGATLGDLWTIERTDRSGHMLHIVNGGPAGGRFVLARPGTVTFRFNGTDWVRESADTDNGERYYSPEDFGAVGDGTTDDTTAWQTLLALPAVYGTSGPLRIRCRPGAIYRITATLRLGATPTSGTTVNYRYIIEGRGAQLKAIGASLGAAPVLELGHYDSGTSTRAQVLYSTISDLDIQGDATTLATDGACGILISCANSCVFERMTIGSMFRGVDCNEEGGNYNVFTDVNVAGADIGVHIGHGATQANVWRWTGGKIQQCRLGMRVEANAGLIVENVDFSICTERSFDAYQASEIALRNVYAEALDYASGNTARLYSFEECVAVDMSACRVNGVGSTYNAAFGVYFDGCKGARLRSSVFTRHKTADVYVSADSQDVVIDEDNRRDASGFASLQGHIKVSDASKASRDLVSTRRLPARPLALHGNQKNYISAPNDFSGSAWTRTYVTVNGTTKAPDGVSDAQILEFPNTSDAGTTANVSILSLTSTATSLGESLDGKTVVLRYWVKPLSVMNEATTVSSRISHFRSIIQREVGDLNSHDTAGCFDGTDGWIFVEHRYAVPNGSVNGSQIRAVTFRPPDALNGISVALWGVQLFVASAAEIVAPILPVFGAFDAVPTTQQADPGIIVDDSGGTASKTIATISDSATANAIASLTAQVNELRRIVRVYGFVRKFDPLTMTGLRLLIDPALSVDAPVDGSAVSTLTNLAGIGNAFTESGSARPTYSATGFGSALDTRCIDFEASSGQRLQSTSAISTFITTSTDVLIAVLQYESVTGTSGSLAQNNDAIFCDSSGGVRTTSLRTSGGTQRATTGMYDGSTFPFAEATLPAADTPFLLVSRHASSVMGVRIDDGAEVTAATDGTTDALTGLAGIGGRDTTGGSPNFDGKLAFLAVLNQYVPDEIERCREYLNDRFGLF